MIRFGPAAAPRWFDQDMGRFADYVALIKECGGSAIEFVLLPGEGTKELGRVHLLEQYWQSAVEISVSGGLVVNSHAPLPPDFGVSRWNESITAYEWRFDPIVDYLASVEAATGRAPVFVLHAAAERPDVTARYLSWLRNRLEGAGCSAQIAVELRAPVSTEDNRFDRNIATLSEFIDRTSVPGVGICWDIAHFWERSRSIEKLTCGSLSMVNHVHLHDSRPDGAVHGPLDHGEIPWRESLRQLQDAGWEGSVTLEIRYRYATEVGEPWSVLRESLLAVRSALAGE